MRTSPAASPAVTRVVCRSQAPAVSAPSRVKVPRASTSPTAETVTDSSRAEARRTADDHHGQLVMGQIRHRAAGERVDQARHAGDHGVQRSHRRHRTPDPVFEDMFEHYPPGWTQPDPGNRLWTTLSAVHGAP